MIYKDFRVAANRHLQTCQYMVGCLTKLKTEERQNILDNIYYLSGYVIECIIKFAIYEYVHYPSQNDISGLRKEYKTFELNYNKDIKSHNLTELSETLQKIGGDTSSLDNRILSFPTLKELYQDWDSEIRYKISPDLKKKLTDSNLQQFVSSISEVYKKLGQ